VTCDRSTTAAAPQTGFVLVDVSCQHCWHYRPNTAGRLVPGRCCWCGISNGVLHPEGSHAHGPFA